MKKILSPLTFSLAALLFLSLAATSARADSVTFVADTLLTGSNSVTGSATVSITDIGATGNVRITVTNNTNGDLTNISLNYTPAFSGAGTITYVSGTGPVPISVVFGNNNVNAPGGTNFDVNFDLPTGQPGGRLNAGESVTFDLDAASALSASGFNTFSFDGKQSFYILVHIQAINPGGNSAKLIGGPAPVPEPATMFLLGTGLAGVAAKMRKRRKAAKEAE